MAEVFHDKVFDPSWRNRTFPDDFVKVAETETDDLEDVFYLTNHVNCAWWENEGVRRIGPECRSTSSGDVVVLKDGTVMVCRTIGWANVGNVKDAPLTFQTGIGIHGDEEQQREEGPQVDQPAV